MKFFFLSVILILSAYSLSIYAINSSPEDNSGRKDTNEREEYSPKENKKHTIKIKKHGNVFAFLSLDKDKLEGFIFGSEDQSLTAISSGNIKKEPMHFFDKKHIKFWMRIDPFNQKIYFYFRQINKDLPVICITLNLPKEFHDLIYDDLKAQLRLLAITISQFPITQALSQVFHLEDIQQDVAQASNVSSTSNEIFFFEVPCHQEEFMRSNQNYSPMEINIFRQSYVHRESFIPQDINDEISSLILQDRLEEVNIHAEVDEEQPKSPEEELGSFLANIGDYMYSRYEESEITIEENFIVEDHVDNKNTTFSNTSHGDEMLKQNKEFLITTVKNTNYQ